MFSSCHYLQHISSPPTPEVVSYTSTQPEPTSADAARAPAIGFTYPNKDVQLTPLMRAAIEGDVELVKRLSQVDTINTQCEHDGNTALHFAVIHHRLDVIKVLLEHPNIDANIYNNAGLTPVLKAVNLSVSNLVRDSTCAIYLIGNRKVNIYLAINDGQSPFDIAKKNTIYKIANLWDKPLIKTAIQHRISTDHVEAIDQRNITRAGYLPFFNERYTKFFRDHYTTDAETIVARRLSK